MNMGRALEEVVEGQRAFFIATEIETFAVDDLANIA